MNEDQAREYAIEHGGATFSVCPVCEQRFPVEGSRDQHEAIVAAHAYAHSPEEFLGVINQLRPELATARSQFLTPNEPHAAALAAAGHVTPSPLPPMVTPMWRPVESTEPACRTITAGDLFDADCRACGHNNLLHSRSQPCVACILLGRTP